jgi:hypothetical protein
MLVWVASCAFRRLLVSTMEVCAESFLLGILLGLLLFPFPNFINMIAGGWALGLAVGLVLFLHGYYLTRAFFGVLWRSQKSWLYPAIAAASFVTHMHIALIRSWTDLTPRAQAREPPFLAGGACIVFVCAFSGNWLLRKWTLRVADGRHQTIEA